MGHGKEKKLWKIKPKTAPINLYVKSSHSLRVLPCADEQVPIADTLSCQHSPVSKTQNMGPVPDLFI